MDLKSELFRDRDKRMIKIDTSKPTDDNKKLADDGPEDTEVQKTPKFAHKFSSNNASAIQVRADMLSDQQREKPYFGPRVNASAFTTSASAEAFKILKLGVGAAAGASAAEAGARADFVNGVIGVKANASAAKASADACGTLCDGQQEKLHFGPRVNASASTTVASAEAFKISKYGVGAAAGASAEEAGASAGFLHGVIGVKANASAAKASAGASSTLSGKQKEKLHFGPRVNESASITLASAEAFKISKYGVGAASGASAAEAGASADFLHGVIGVKANVSKAKASAGASGTLSGKQKEKPNFEPRVNESASTTLASAEAFKISKYGVGAASGASVAEAGASADFVNGVIGVEANASAAKASAGASASVMGLEAKANAHVAKLQCGVKNTPLQVSVGAIEAGAHAGASVRYVGASLGVYLAETKVGPFAVRAGVKFGAAIENGIPVIDVGPVTTPCCII